MRDGHAGEVIAEERRLVRLPLRIQLKTLGLLSARHERPFSPYELDLLRLVAGALSLALPELQQPIPVYELLGFWEGTPQQRAARPAL